MMLIYATGRMPRKGYVSLQAGQPDASATPKAKRYADMAYQHMQDHAPDKDQFFSEYIRQEHLFYVGFRTHQSDQKSRSTGGYRGGARGIADLLILTGVEISHFDQGQVEHWRERMETFHKSEGDRLSRLNRFQNVRAEYAEALITLAQDMKVQINDPDTEVPPPPPPGFPWWMIASAVGVACGACIAGFIMVADSPEPTTVATDTLTDQQLLEHWRESCATSTIEREQFTLDALRKDGVYPYVRASYLGDTFDPFATHWPDIPSDIRQNLLGDPPSLERFCQKRWELLGTIKRKWSFIQVSDDALSKGAILNQNAESIYRTSVVISDGEALFAKHILTQSSQ